MKQIPYKKCPMCKTVRHFKDYGRLSSRPDGMRRECNHCRTDYRRKNGEKPQRVLDGNYDARECTACREIKCLSQFHKNKAISDGRNLVCKACATRRKKQRTLFDGGAVRASHDPNAKARECTGCGELKLLNQYPVAKQCKDGRASECKECKNMKAEKKKLSHPEPTEHQEAIGFINWFHRSFPNVFIYHIPNGMKRDIRTAKALKDEGVKRGVPDYHIPEWNLWMELKRRTRGSLSKDQRRVISHLESIGHTVIVGRGAEDASKKILEFVQKRFDGGGD